MGAVALGKVTIFRWRRITQHSLAGKLKAPIVHALRGKEIIDYDNPFDVGMMGLFGFSSGYRAMMDCDTLLMLGTDFPYQQFYPEKATDYSSRHSRGADRAANQDRSRSGG